MPRITHSDDHVRAVAVMSWASYSLHSRDPDTMRTLYQTLVDDNQPRRVRGMAYNSFFTVYQPTNEGLPKAAMQLDKTIDECVDWKRVDAAVEESGTWRPSGPSLQEVTRLAYVTDRLSVVLARETFEITQGGRTERGQAHPRSWIRMLGAMGLGGFPSPSASEEGERISLEWTRNGKVERVTAFSKPLKYRDIIRVAHELASETHEPLPVVSNTTVVSTIEYTSGSATALYGFGLRRLTLHSDERFEVLFQRHEARHVWRGTLNVGTFDRALAILRAADFPDPGPQRRLIPGEQTRRVGLERGGSWECVSLYEEDARYVELVKLNSSILAPLDDTLARMPPDVASPIVEVYPVDR